MRACALERVGETREAARTSTASRSRLLRMASATATFDFNPGLATTCTLVLPDVGTVAAVLEA